MLGLFSYRLREEEAKAPYTLSYRYTERGEATALSSTLASAISKGHPGVTPKLSSITNSSLTSSQILGVRNSDGAQRRWPVHSMMAGTSAGKTQLARHDLESTEAFILQMPAP